MKDSAESLGPSGLDPEFLNQVERLGREALEQAGGDGQSSVGTYVIGYPGAYPTFAGLTPRIKSLVRAGLQYEIEAEQRRGDNV